MKDMFEKFHFWCTGSSASTVHMGCVLLFWKTPQGSPFIQMNNDMLSPSWGQSFGVIMRSGIYARATWDPQNGPGALV